MLQHATERFRNLHAYLQCARETHQSTLLNGHVHLTELDSLRNPLAFSC